jgi:pimeloyl-ACP methyl ester carboxylesterase
MMATAKANGETDETMKAAGDGMNASGAALIGVTVLTDLPATAPSFRMPYYVIQGRDDLHAPTPLARAYFDKVQAPKKQYAVVEEGGHFALATHAAEVDRLLREMVK